jgi:hypothetical protein
VEAGARRCWPRRGCWLDAIWYEQLRERSVQNQTHSVLLGRLCAALRAKTESVADFHLEDWQGDQLPARGSYDLVPCRGCRPASFVVKPRLVKCGCQFPADLR